MFAFVFLLTFIIGFIDQNETLLIASGLIAIASAIESFTYLISKFI